MSKYEAKQSGGFWYVYEDGKCKGDWIVNRMPDTKEQCEDAAQRLNAGATIRDLPYYRQPENMQRIVARAPWGDTYTAQDAEDGHIPSEAYYMDEED